MMEERIYIGGLDPQYLAAEEVASRLRLMEGVEISSTEMKETFFYVNAISKDEGATALDKIAKQYHNVTWKRCKLVVQAAKPHFLERLSKELEERKQVQVKAENQKEKQYESSNIPRHLRIRRRFGQEAYRVDTKPCQAEDWSGFGRSLQKMRQRRQVHGEKVLLEPQKDAVRRKPFHDRSLHLRWDETYDGKSQNGVPSLVEAEDASSNDESSSSSSSQHHDTESDETEDNDSVPAEDLKSSTYVWSDDQSGDGSSNEDRSIAASEGHVHIGHDVDDISSDESMSSESDGDDDEKVSRNGNVGADGKSGQDSWTSDEDESTEYHPLASPTRKDSRATGTTEEFSAGVDFDGRNDDDMSDADGDESDVVNRNGSIEAGEGANTSEASLDLRDEVKTNIGVLSTLFPELASAISRLPQSDNEGGKAGEAKTIQPGWEMSSDNPSLSLRLGLMQRFDPTKESAKKYIVDSLVALSDMEETSREEQEPNGDDEDDEPSRESQSFGANEKTQEQVNPSKEAIYEQSKLEVIFREARSLEASKSLKVSSAFYSEAHDSDRGAISAKPFAFGFDVSEETVETNNRQETTQRSPFAFSFDVGKVSPATVQKLGLETKKREATTKDEGENETGSMGICRRGFSFPEHVLNEFTKKFFAMNEGSRMLRDPQGFLHDEGIKSQWGKERQTLTLDWKRKRKYAQSRMQKKMKFR